MFADDRTRAGDHKRAERRDVDRAAAVASGAAGVHDLDSDLEALGVSPHRPHEAGHLLHGLALDPQARDESGDLGRGRGCPRARRRGPQRPPPPSGPGGSGSCRGSPAIRRGLSKVATVIAPIRSASQPSQVQSAPVRSVRRSERLKSIRGGYRDAFAAPSRASETENRDLSGGLAVLADDPTTLALGEPTPHAFTLAGGK